MSTLKIVSGGRPATFTNLKKIKLLDANETYVVASFAGLEGATPPSYPNQTVIANNGIVEIPGNPIKSGYELSYWEPSLPRTIVQNTVFTAQWNRLPMTLTYNKVGSDIIFSINNLSDPILTHLSSGKFLRLQLVRYTRSKHLNKDKTLKLKPTYPSYIGAENGRAVLEEHKANIRIDNLTLNSMNLTTWFNNMLKWGSANYTSQLRAKIISTNINDDGYWFQDYGFCLLINNEKHFFESSPIFRVKMYNSGNININTNYTINQYNEIELYAL